MEHHKTLLPTRKWIAAQMTAAAALLTAWVSVGDWTSTLSISAIGLLTQAAISYLVPNADTPGGVPERTELEPVPAGGVR